MPAQASPAPAPSSPPAAIAPENAAPAAPGTATQRSERPAQAEPPSVLAAAAPASGPAAPSSEATVTVPVPPPAPAPAKSDIGIDLGGSGTPASLSARWRAIKANHGPLLVGLHPLSSPDPRPGHPPYRLVLGPLPDAAAAARLCTLLAAAHTACRPAPFTGMPLAPP
ncbi:MAG: SPOR domain-containing protein [Pseudolabrys sp.]|nr:SPOR domain-containing protein [Pseudolabrys sp.]